LADHEADRMTAAAIRALQFPTGKGFGRGYDSADVDRAIARCADTVESLSKALVTAQDTVAELQARLERESSDAVIEHAVNVLTTAQETADKILAQADHQRERADSERQAVLAQAHEAAGLLQRNSHRRAKQMTDSATRRAAALEQEIARLTLAADTAQQELDREAVRLEAALEASRTQFDDAIDDILAHVAEQYGRAHPLAAQAAIARRRAAGTAATRQPGSTRSRRGLRLAGRPADRRAEATNAPDGTSAGSDLPQQDNRRPN